MAINVINEDYGSITLDVLPELGADDMVRIFKAIMMWMGFAMRTIDSIFDEELRELDD